MINLILFGPPGSGKGTQAAKLVEKYGLLHISTGDLFRSEIQNATTLGLKAQDFMKRGELVPDEVTIGMLRNKVESHPELHGIIFDGFPRTRAQAAALDDLLAERDDEVSRLIMLEVPDEEIIQRLLNRGLVSGRADDRNEEIIANRITVYRRETSPVYDYYAEKGKAVKVDGVGEIDDIFERLAREVEAYKAV